jgi:citrate/tricarballylate utilization protein
MVIGAGGLAWLKIKADPALGAAKVWGGEMAFILLLALVAASGLLLYGFGDTAALSALFALHLASILVLFLLMPFSKMVHGFFRLTALIVEAGQATRP